MVKGLPSIQHPSSSCESCIFAKNHREKFVSGVSYRVKAPLEIVHIVLCGPMQTTSLSGNVFFLTFIDDYTRKTWGYLLKEKYEAFYVFKIFIYMVEKGSGNNFKILR